MKNNSNSLKKILNLIFIDGFSGMATGLFATLIIGTIICQIGSYLPAMIGQYVIMIGTMAKCLTGAGIGIGVAMKFKQSPLITISASVCGMIGAYSSKLFVNTDVSSLLQDKISNSGAITLSKFISSIIGVGEPLGAFIAVLVGILIGKIIIGKTKIDIIVTPLATITIGGTAGILIGPYVVSFLNYLGSLVNWGTEQSPFIMGIVVSVLMGIFLTLPISSAAIGISLSLSGIAAGAATVGCCCQMVGFAVISFRENKIDGLLSQGLGTSMLQMPNIIKNPVIWVPPTLASAILGPISTIILKISSNSIGSGMGTSGLVGPLQTFEVMKENMNHWTLILVIFLLYFLIPAILSLFFAKILRHKKLIHENDLKLTL